MLCWGEPGGRCGRRGRRRPHRPQEHAGRRITDVPDEQADTVGSYHRGGIRTSSPTTARPLQQWPLDRLLSGDTFTDWEHILERPDGSRRRVASSGSVVLRRVWQGWCWSTGPPRRHRAARARARQGRADPRHLSRPAAPLTVILGQAQMAQKGAERPDAVEKGRPRRSSRAQSA